MGTRPGGRNPEGSRLYQLLLRLYPVHFRERLGDAMAETFEEERSAARARGPAALAGLWLRTLLRTPLLAVEERIRASSSRVGGPGAHGRLGSLVLDLHLSLRGLARSPGFTLATALTVGLGVGATASLYSMVDALLLRPLPVESPERLVRVEEVRDRYFSVGLEGSRMTLDRYRTVREATTGEIFTGLVGHNFRGLSLRADGPAVPVAGVLASGNYFEVLGVRPALGRFFSRDDEPSAVLSHALWQSRFGADPSVVGRTVHVGGLPFTVVGVTSAGFSSTVGFLRPEVWVPIAAHDGTPWTGARVATFGRLAPGIERAVAEERTGAVMQRIPVEDDPETEVRGAAVEPMTPIPPSMAGSLRGFLFMLFATGVLVLLIAGANVAGVLMARTARRAQELAVRLALGIGRFRLIRQSLLEAVLLFAGGGLVGLGLAELTGRLLSGLTLPTPEPIAVDLTPASGTVLFAMAVAVGTGLLFGLFPAIQASRSEVVRTLREGAYGTSRRRSRLRDLFVAAQVAMSVILLVGAVLFVRTAHGAMTADPGFDVERVVLAQVNLRPHGYDIESGEAFFQELYDRIANLPGVQSVAWAELPLLTGARSTFGAWRLAPDDEGVQAGQNTVDEHYFETMEVEVRAGRGIDASDVAGAPNALVVNESFARRFWPEGDPIGKTVLRGELPYTVVGLVPDGAYTEFGEGAAPFAFLSLDQRFRFQRTLHLKARPRVEASALIREVRREVAALDADIAVEQAAPLKRAMASLLFPQRFAAALIGSFGILGLFLAATGVYAVLANLVVQRTREFGIRIALGARASELIGRVLRQGGLLALTGGVVGLGLAAGLTGYLSDLLFGISPLDPVAFLGVPLLIVVVALVASFLPARRILGLDPVEALREE